MQFWLRVLLHDAALSTITHFTPMPSAEHSQDLLRAWSFPYAATLGSSARRRGIFLEIRARLPLQARKALKLEAGVLRLRMPAEAERQFAEASQVIINSLEDIEALPIIPREIEDILQITSTERHRWLRDGRLPSAGTRTVKLCGRAREVTFHVFDPRIVEDILDRDRVTDWREEDAATAAENRRRAAWKAKLTRVAESEADRPVRGTNAKASSKLVGWDEFERNGPLRRPNRH